MCRICTTRFCLLSRAGAHTGLRSHSSSSCSYTEPCSSNSNTAAHVRLGSSACTGPTPMRSCRLCQVTCYNLVCCSLHLHLISFGSPAGLGRQVAPLQDKPAALQYGMPLGCLRPTSAPHAAWLCGIWSVCNSPSQNPISSRLPLVCIRHHLCRSRKRTGASGPAQSVAATQHL
jgi:hypothetical protein